MLCPTLLVSSLPFPPICQAKLQITLGWSKTQSHPQGQEGLPTTEHSKRECAGLEQEEVTLQGLFFLKVPPCPNLPGFWVSRLQGNGP